MKIIDCVADFSGDYFFIISINSVIKNSELKLASKTALISSIVKLVQLGQSYKKVVEHLFKRCDVRKTNNITYKCYFLNNFKLFHFHLLYENTLTVIPCIRN